MKNPFTYLKHLIKDPVQTIEEADKRKKQILPIFIGLVVVLAAIAVICILCNAMFFAIIAVGALIFAAWYFTTILSIIEKVKAKFAILTCDSCQERADFTDQVGEYTKYVSYKVLSERTKVSVDCPKPANNGVISKINVSAKSTALVEVTLKCPKCGVEKIFNYEIDTFECLVSQSNVPAGLAVTTRANLEKTVRDVVSIYESKETRDSIPFTVHSIHHPNYENRTKLQMVGTEYNGVTVKYHTTIDEMVEGFFVRNDVSGNIIKQKK